MRAAWSFAIVFLAIAGFGCIRAAEYRPGDLGPAETDVADAADVRELYESLSEIQEPEIEDDLTDGHNGEAVADTPEPVEPADVADAGGDDGPGVDCGEAGCLADSDGDGVPDIDDCMPFDKTVAPGFPEVCDGKDNDCDGQMDEGPLDPPTCELTNAYGTCLGTAICEKDAPGCVGAYPAQETCNGWDDNCDGTSDEGFPDSDGDGLADCVDMDTDSDGIPDFKDNCPETPNPDQADADKDAKGDSCDDDRDGDGEPNDTDCAPDDSSIFPAQVEFCNKKDDNCDDVIDKEGAIGCLPLYEDKDGDGWGLEAQKCLCDPVGDFKAHKPGDCDDTSKAVHPEAVEVCNLQDDDCDGETDEDLGTTVCGLGVCRTEVPTCKNGKLQKCVPGTPKVEVCDLMDNDCDGETDEDLGTSACGKGQCLHPVANCKDGVPETCDPLLGRKDEMCNSLDDDCDGETDNGAKLCGNSDYVCCKGICKPGPCPSTS